MSTPGEPQVAAAAAPEHAEASRNAQGIVTIKVSVAGRGEAKKPKSSFFYVDLASKYLKDNEQIELSGLGYAIGSVVTIAEIIKSQGIAEIKKINTTMTTVRERRSQKPKIEILLQRAAKFEEVVKHREEVAAENKALKEAVQKAQTEFQEKLKAQTK